MASPPPEVFLAAYFKYEPPGHPGDPPAEEVTLPSLAEL